MSRKTIAVDIDDVLAVNAPAFLAYSNEKWGTRLTLENFTEDWADMWKVDDVTRKARAQEIDDSRFKNTYKHFEDAVPVLKKLGKDYKLVIATARRKVLAPDTVEWIEQYFPGVFEEYHYAGIWDELTNKDAHLMTKGELVKAIGADYLIDDQPKHCLAAADAGLQAIVFGDYPWNRHVELTDRMARAHSWAEVEAYFDSRG